MMTRVLERRFALPVIIGAALVVYLNSLWNGFAYDDLWIILENKRVHQLRDLGQIWLTPYWPDWGEQLGLYRPLTIFLFALQWAVADGAPWVFHAVNVLAHAAVCVLAYLLADRLFGRTVAFATALVFAVHPVHTEAVANVVGQGELWAALGVFAGCLIYASRPDGVAISYRRMSAILAIYAITLLAKEHAAVLPGLLVLLDVVQGRVQRTRAGIVRYVHAVGFMLGLLFALLLAYITMRVHVLGSFGGSDVAPGLPFLKEGHRVLNAFRAWPEYVRLLFAPIDLAVSYVPATVLPVESITPMVVLGMLLAVATIAIAAATPVAPRAGLVAGWFFISILPVSNLLFPVGVLVAERTLYMPSLAACFLAGFAWEAIQRSSVLSRRRLGYAAALLLLVAFGARTYVRNPDWKSLRAVWNGLARDHPESYLSQWVYAVTAAATGQPERAEQHFLVAERVWPRDARFLQDFGNFYIEHQQYDKAIPRLERAVELTPWAPVLHELLAYSYVSVGRSGDAIESARRANSMAGAYRMLNFSVMASAYEQLGDFEKSIGAWRAAAHSTARQGHWLQYAHLARVLARSGNTAGALAAADSAHQRAGRGTRMEGAARAVQRAIRSGCYQSADPACDPLREWKFTPGYGLTGAGK